MFEMEHITKWPISNDETEWNVHTKKVIRSLNQCHAPCLIGQIDVLSGQRPRIIRAVSETEVIVLKGQARLLFEYLTHQQIQAMTLSVQDKNPYDIGKVYLASKYTNDSYKKVFQDALGVNPYPVGIKHPLRPKSGFA